MPDVLSNVNTALVAVGHAIRALDDELRPAFGDGALSRALFELHDAGDALNRAKKEMT